MTRRSIQQIKNGQARWRLELEKIYTDVNVPTTSFAKMIGVTAQTVTKFLLNGEDVSLNQIIKIYKFIEDRSKELTEVELTNNDNKIV